MIVYHAVVNSICVEANYGFVVFHHLRIYIMRHSSIVFICREPDSQVLNRICWKEPVLVWLWH